MASSSPRKRKDTEITIVSGKLNIFVDKEWFNTSKSVETYLSLAWATKIDPIYVIDIHPEFKLYDVKAYCLWARKEPQDKSFHFTVFSLLLARFLIDDEYMNYVMKQDIKFTKAAHILICAEDFPDVMKAQAKKYIVNVTFSRDLMTYVPDILLPDVEADVDEYDILTGYRPDDYMTKLNIALAYYRAVDMLDRDTRNMLHEAPIKKTQ